VVIPVTDLNTLGENLIVAWEAQVATARARIEAIRRDVAPAAGYDEYNRVHLAAPIAEAAAEIAWHERHIAEMRDTGRLLVDPGDVKWQMTNRHLIDEFQSAVGGPRVVYVEPQASPVLDALFS
jgi:hypothetical protein